MNGLSVIGIDVGGTFTDLVLLDPDGSVDARESARRRQRTRQRASWRV